MRITIINLIYILCISSCSSPYSFQRFYNEEKNEADLAISVPKYMAMIAIPKEEKNEIRPFLKGMKKVRFLYNETVKSNLSSSFENFAEDHNYKSYIYIKQDGNQVNLFAKEEEGNVREIILDFNADDSNVILGLMGKMKKETFQKVISEATKNY